MPTDTDATPPLVGPISDGTNMQITTRDDQAIRDVAFHENCLSSRPLRYTFANSEPLTNPVSRAMEEGDGRGRRDGGERGGGKATGGGMGSMGGQVRVGRRRKV